MAICCWNTEKKLGNAKKYCEYCVYLEYFYWIHRSIYSLKFRTKKVFTTKYSECSQYFQYFFCISQYILSISATNCHLITRYSRNTSKYFFFGNSIWEIYIVYTCICNFSLDFHQFFLDCKSKYRAFTIVYLKNVADFVNSE